MCTVFKKQLSCQAIPLPFPAAPLSLSLSPSFASCLCLPCPESRGKSRATSSAQHFRSWVLCIFECPPHTHISAHTHRHTLTHSHSLSFFVPLLSLCLEQWQNCISPFSFLHNAPAACSCVCEECVCACVCACASSVVPP